MKRLFFDEHSERFRIADASKGCPFIIGRAVIDEVRIAEKKHYHPESTEVYIFISGVAEMFVNDEVITVRGGDIVIVDPGEPHRMMRIIERLDYMAIRDSTDDNDKVIVED